MSAEIQDSPAAPVAALTLTQEDSWLQPYEPMLLARQQRLAERLAAITKEYGSLSKFAEKAKVIHIDIDAAEIGKNVAAYVPIVGDAKTVLAQLLDDTKLCHREWIQEIRNFELPMQLPKEPKITKCTDCTAPNMKNSDVPPPCRKKDSVDPKVVLEMVSDLLQDDLIVAGDLLARH